MENEHRREIQDSIIDLPKYASDVSEYYGEILKPFVTRKHILKHLSSKDVNSIHWNRALFLAYQFERVEDGVLLSWCFILDTVIPLIR